VTRPQLAIALGAALLVLWIALVARNAITAPQKAAAARAGQVLAQGRAAAGADAVEAVSNRSTAEAGIDAIKTGNDHAIRTAPGADAPVDPALAAAGLRGLCKYANYRDRPECVQFARPR
jgi:hypothetical protein